MGFNSGFKGLTSTRDVVSDQIHVLAAVAPDRKGKCLWSRWIGGWVCPRAVFDALEKRSLAPAGSRTTISRTSST